jgi:hypothetical protein
MSMTVLDAIARSRYRFAMRLVLLLVALSLPAQAQSLLASDTPRQSFMRTAPAQFNPVSDTRGGLLLGGLGLVAAGLILGGAGFYILYTCQPGDTCDVDNHMRTIGWVLAAPGIIPLAVGAFLVYISTGGRATVRVDGSEQQTLPFALGFAPIRGGAVSSATFAF